MAVIIMHYLHYSFGLRKSSRPRDVSFRRRRRVVLCGQRGFRSRDAGGVGVTSHAVSMATRRAAAAAVGASSQPGHLGGALASLLWRGARSERRPPACQVRTNPLHCHCKSESSSASINHVTFTTTNTALNYTQRAPV